MSQENVEITQATPDRLPALASVLGRAFVTEPMLRWSLGEHGEVEARFIRCFECYIEALVPLGAVWEAGEATGALVLEAPDQAAAWHQGTLGDNRIHELTEDGGHRYDVFWAWLESMYPDEPLAHLDSIAVEPKAQGQGIGSALIEHGLAAARADGHGLFLDTGNPRNVVLYERHGFRVVEGADAPDGGPHVWFMRWDP